MVTWNSISTGDQGKMFFVLASQIIHTPLLAFWPTKNDALFVVKNVSQHWRRVEELDARLLSPYRGGWSIYLPEITFSLFDCTLLIGKYLHFLIAFDSDCPTGDDFSWFFGLFFFFYHILLGLFCLVFSFSFVSSSMAFTDHIKAPSVLCYIKHPTFRLLSNIIFVTLAVPILLFYICSLRDTRLKICLWSSFFFLLVAQAIFVPLWYIRNSWYLHVILSIESEKVSIWLEKSFSISRPCLRRWRHTYCILLTLLSPCQRLSLFISFHMGSFPNLLATSNTSGSLLHLCRNIYGLQFTLKPFVNYFWTHLSALWQIVLN